LQLAFAGCSSPSDTGFVPVSDSDPDAPSNGFPVGHELDDAGLATASTIIVFWGSYSDPTLLPGDITYEVAYAQSRSAVATLPWGEGATSATQGSVVFDTPEGMLNSFVITGLLPDTTYYVNISAHVSQGIDLAYNAPETGFTTTGPTTTSNRRLVTASPQAFLLDWTNHATVGPDGGYLLVRNKGSVVQWWPTNVEEASEAWADEFTAGMYLSAEGNELLYVGPNTYFFDSYENLEEDATYYYKVIAVDSFAGNPAIEWAYYGVVRGIGIRSKPTPCCGEPKIDVYAEATPTSITVSWDKATDATTAQRDLTYAVAISENLADVSSLPWGEGATNSTQGFVSSFTQDGSLNQWVITGLTPETTYYVNVAVKNTGGQTNLYTPAASGITTPAE
jgi:hypothetical protein